MRKRKWSNTIILVFFVSVIVILANVLGFFSGNFGHRITITTSIYATLITILLALLALAVTAYIFLATALKERRESYVQKTVEQMLAVRTKQLLFLTIFGILSLLLCFLIDNADSELKFPACLHFLTITGASIACVLLMFYICTIITYDHGLRTFAYRARRIIFLSESGEQIDHDMSDVIKSIGDLEMLVMTLVANHKDNFHGADAFDTIRTIMEDQSENYDKLISYRDYLRIEQQTTGKSIRITKKEYDRVRKTIKEVEDGLKERYLLGERLKNLNFVAPFLQISEKKFFLKATVFSESAFEKVDFSNAILNSADFSQTRLNEVNFEGANCTEGIFSEAVFREIKVDTGSIFRNAVFRNTDFGRQKFDTDSSNAFCFEGASFVHANLIECILVHVIFNMQISTAL